MINRLVKRLLDKLPYIRNLRKKVDFYESALLVPPGHFYSALVNTQEIIDNKDQIFNINKTIYGLNLNLDDQFILLNSFKEFYNDLIFPDEKEDKLRYYYKNEAFSYSDSIFLYSMIRHFKPKKIIEIGSGFSSAAMLDINESFFNNSIKITFVEPFPEVLKGLLQKDDIYTLISEKVQDIDCELFKTLENNDILFIDSTHVVKTNSDVLYELLQILPNLKKGVKIHFHDIFYPFEYPKEWVIEQKRNWNEIYFIQAFLMFNTHFKILAFNTYLEHMNQEWFRENMPLCLKNTGGSLWLEKIS